jgi:hypothetical protein
MRFSPGSTRKNSMERLLKIGVSACLATLGACGSHNAANNQGTELNAATETNTVTDMNSTADLNATGNTDLNASNLSANNAAGNGY